MMNPLPVNSKAADLMRTEVVTARLESTVAEMAALMLEKHVGSVVIVDDQGIYAGTVTEENFLPHQEAYPFMRGTVNRVMGINTGADRESTYSGVISQLSKLHANQVMNSKNPTATPDTSIDDVVELMMLNRCQHIPILSDGKPVGVVARHDVLHLFAD